MDTLARLYPSHIQTLKERHDRALAAAGFDSVVIFAGGEHVAFLDDSTYPFKANPHFKAWVPVVDNPNCFLFYAPSHKPVLIFFQPVDYWYKPAATPNDYWVQEFDLRVIPSAEDAQRHIPFNGKRVAFIGEPDPLFESWGIAGTNPETLLSSLHFDRAWKTDYEVECIRRANTIGARGHIAAERAFRAGATEWEIHQEYLRATSHNEPQLPYGNIVALNENASVLHYQHQQRDKPPELRSFLIDAGATYNGYASDITRTYSAKRDEFQELVDAMDRMQQGLCSQVRPGLDYPRLHLDAHAAIAGILEQFGIVKLPAAEIVERKISSAFFPHGVGHYLGLQVHDIGGFLADRSGATIPKPEGHSYLRLTRTVEPGMVFTIEPGLYFIDMLLKPLRESSNGEAVNWEKVDAFRKFGGIRIEDDVVVTQEGHENLTRPAFDAVAQK